MVSDDHSAVGHETKGTVKSRAAVPFCGVVAFGLARKDGYDMHIACSLDGEYGAPYGHTWESSDYNVSTSGQALEDNLNHNLAHTWALIWALWEQAGCQMHTLASFGVLLASVF